MKIYNEQINNKLNSSNSGFTLIELMIATTLFTIVMLMGVGSLVVSSNSAKASQKLRTAVDNVNFAMESMTREFRMGTYYDCSHSSNLSIVNELSDCLNGDYVMAFTPQQDISQTIKRVAYSKYLRSDGLTSGIQRCEYNGSTTICSDVVSTDVDIKELRFYVKGSGIHDLVQPGVRILIKGTITLKGIVTPFSLQTMSSQRSAEK